MSNRSARKAPKRAAKRRYLLLLANEMGRVETAVLEYVDLGFDPIPLKPGTKKPAVAEWPTRNPSSLWRGMGWDVNVGIRMGGASQLAVIDCDEAKQPGTYERIVRHLAESNHLPGDYPVVQSASGNGRHIYFLFQGALNGNSRNLSNDFGAGEFRYGQGAYVTAPPSRVDGNLYQLVAGDFRQLPRLGMEEVLPILGNKDIAPEHSRMSPEISRNTLALLKGNNVSNYDTRSEAEMALITMLINCGIDFEGVLDLFKRFPAAGKFKEIFEKDPGAAVRWLRSSYNNALEWSSAHQSEGRQMAVAALNWAESHLWLGRTGLTDKAVFMAHATFAYKSAQLTYAAAVRDLAKIAGLSRPTVSKANVRLCEKGLLIRVRPAFKDFATQYRLLMPKGQNLTSPSPPACGEVVNFYSHDAFRWGGGLNRTGAAIYAILLSESLTDQEIAERTGKNLKTVQRLLKRMSGLVDVITGEICSMVQKDENGFWIGREVDLDHVAKIVGTAGKGKAQRIKHEKERFLHRQALANGRRRERS